MLLSEIQRINLGLTLAVFGLLTCSCGGGSSQSDEPVTRPPSVVFAESARGLLVAFRLVEPAEPTPGVTVSWDFGDGTTGEGFRPVHYYSEPGNYSVTARLVDERLQQAEHTRSFTLASADPCVYSWQPLRRPRVTAEVQGLAAGEPGFVMAGRRGSLMFSNNGFDWCDSPSLQGENFRDVRWVNDSFIATAVYSRFDVNLERFLFQSNFAVSQDGIQWAVRQGPAAWVSAVAGNGSLVLALGHVPTGGANDRYAVYYEDESQGWREVLTPDALLQNLMWDGRQFILFGRQDHQFFAPGDVFWTSPDGFEWTRHEPSDGKAWANVSSNGTRQVRVHDRIEYSDDGLNWTDAGVEVPGPTERIVWGGGQFVVLDATRVMTSEDGENWMSRALELPFQISDVHLAWNGWVWLIAGPDGMIAWSSDGLNWQLPFGEEPLRDPINWTAALVRGNEITVCGYQLAEGGVLGRSLVQWSDDGQDWTTLTIYESALYDVARGTGSEIVAVGGHAYAPELAGRAYLFSSGQWQDVLQTERELEHVVFGADYFLAVDVRGQVFRSTNGVAWEAGTTLGHLVQIEVIDGRFWALNEENALFNSEDGIVWSAEQLPADYGNVRAFTHREGTWLVTGDRGDLGHSVFGITSDFENWQTTYLTDAVRINKLTANVEGFYASGAFGFGEVFGGEAQFAPFYFSPDGLNWQPEFGPHVRVSDLTATDDGVVAAGRDFIVRRVQPN